MLCDAMQLCVHHPKALEHVGDEVRRPARDESHNDDHQHVDHLEEKWWKYNERQLLNGLGLWARFLRYTGLMFRPLTGKPNDAFPEK